MSTAEGQLTLAPAARAGVQVVWIEPVGSVHLGQQLSDVHHLKTTTKTTQVWEAGTKLFKTLATIEDIVNKGGFFSSLINY